MTRPLAGKILYPVSQTINKIIICVHDASPLRPPAVLAHPASVRKYSLALGRPAADPEQDHPWPILF